MRTYHWKEYGFIGTVPDFARHFGICKSPTFVNAVRRVSRHVYNCMNAREQAEYEEKRERVKPAYRLYLDEERTRFIEMTKEEYEAVGLPWCRKRSACSNCLTGTEACPHRLSETVGTKAPWLRP